MNIREATVEINKILRQLEHSTGSVVEEISLTRIDTTSVSDENQVLQTTVAIELKRMPTQNWSV